MAIESGSYDDATLARRYAMAQKLLDAGADKTVIKSWTQGLANVANSALGGYEWSKADEERRAEKTQGTADLYGALGIPAPATTPEAPTGGFQKLAALLNGAGGGAAPDATTSIPAPGVPSDQASYPPPPAPGPPPTTFRPGITAPAGPMPAVSPNNIYSQDQLNPIDVASRTPAGPTVAPDNIYSQDQLNPMDVASRTDPSLPRGLRNNNPLNIEAGSFTQGQPGFVGSDGRFAKFEAPEQGMAAANKLLDSYQAKGLNTPAAIIGRWAPQGENNSAAYAATVAKKLGIGPNDQITPEMRPALIAAMSEVENGKASAIPQIATALGPTGDAALPPGATPAQGALPTAAQAAAPSDTGLLAGVPIEKKTQIAQLLTSNNPTAKALGTTMLQQYAKPETTDEIKEYNLAKKQGFDGSFFEYKTGLKKAGAQNITTNVGGGSDKQIFDTMDESAKAARTTAQGLTGLREARNAIQGGVITGAGADAKLALQKVGASLGVVDPTKIVNTETFRSAIAPQVASVLKSTVGTTNISNTDREFAEKAAGGNINLDEKSISRLLDVMERASSGQLEAHQKRLEKVYPDAEKYARERALFNVDTPAAPPAPPAITPAAPIAPDKSALEAEMRKRGLLK